MKVFAFALAGAVALGACTTTDQHGYTSRNNARTGALMGAIGGAIAGCATNTNSGRQCAKNAVLGAGIGAIAGGSVGAYMDRQQRELEQQLSSTGVGVVRDGDDIYLVMPSDITFQTNSASVNPSFSPVLADVATTLNKYPATAISVEGHADKRGDDQYNMNLSRSRAQNVSNVLAGQGVVGERLNAMGYGETRPVDYGDTAAAYARNRRVEIRIIPVVAE